MAAISPENCELEVKHKDDGSWHPCRISLSDDNLDIIVQFESCGDKDIISEEKDALARLRYRSVPVGKGGCSEIGQGECVLAVHEGQGASLFFDAVVMEPQRVKHSKRANCKCLFQIKWLNPEMEKNILSVSSPLIRKLSKKSITSHSVIDAFLNSLNPAASANGSPPNSLLDETIWGLVEKIEETSKCTEKSTEWAGDNFLRAKRGKKLSGVALETVTKGPNNSRRPTRNQAKQEVKTDDKPLEDKPFVSPLAACAALASYIHELSPNHGTLFSQLEKEVPAASILVKSDTSNTSAVSNPPKRSRPLSKVRSSDKSQSSDSQVSSARPRRSSQVSNLSNGGLSSPPITEHQTIPLPVADRELSGREMLRFRIEPDAHIVTTALTACSHSGALRQGIWIHRLLEREYSLFLRDIYVGTALVSMYAKCGCIEEAVRVFDGMPKRNSHVWSAMIGGFAMHGFSREAVGCLERMWDEDGLRVDGVVLLGALVACAHGGLVEEGLEIFAVADVGYGVVPVHEHYSSVVDMLCRVGRLEEAVGVIRRMPMRPRESVWGSLLTGCRNYGNVVLAEMAVGELEKLETGADEGIYVQLSNIYMNANKREEARRVRKMIGSKGIKKTTAYSTIVVGEEMSSFVAGDQVHPRRLEIFKILDWLMDHISDDYL